MTKWLKCTCKFLQKCQNDKMMKMNVQTLINVSEWQNDENVRSDSYIHHIPHIHTSHIYLTQVAVRVLTQVADRVLTRVAVREDGTCQRVGGVNTMCVCADDTFVTKNKSVVYVCIFPLGTTKNVHRYWTKVGELDICTPFYKVTFMK